MKTTLKILHLEDLASDAALVERELDKAERSYEKLVVDTGQKFLQALTEFKPDIILSDHSLPSFNSIEALKIIKEAGLNARTVLACKEIGDVQEYLVHQSNALLVSTSDPASEFCKQLKAVYGQADQLQALGQALKKTVLERFNISTILPEYNRIHLELESHGKN